MSDFDDDDMLYDSDAGSMGEVADEDDPAVRAENRYFEAKGAILECSLRFSVNRSGRWGRPRSLWSNAGVLRNWLQ